MDGLALTQVNESLRYMSVRGTAWSASNVSVVLLISPDMRKVARRWSAR
jgi:hypothetical protein